MTRSKDRVELVQELSSDLRGVISSSIAIRSGVAILHCQAQESEHAVGSGTRTANPTSA